MKTEKLLKELERLKAGQIAQIIAAILPKCLPESENWKDYYSRYFPFWEKKGFHITLNHFYSPLPEVYKLRKKLWKETPEVQGINFNEKSQLALLDKFWRKYRQEYNKIPIKKTSDNFQYYLKNRQYQGIDGYILYCMIRHFKPKRIIEIGSGFSSLLTAQACRKNKEEDGLQTTFIAIEPYPSETLQKGFPGLIKLIHKKVQEVSPKIFERLESGDFLFIDSSHVLKIDNDVKFEYTDILPRLKKGVIIHIHDIFLPAEYPKKVIYNLFLFTEQYLVQAILANSDAFKIIWATYFMYLKHFGKLKRAFSAYKNFRKGLVPSSFWIRKRTNSASYRFLS